MRLWFDTATRLDVYRQIARLPERVTRPEPPRHPLPKPITLDEWKAKYDRERVA